MKRLLLYVHFNKYNRVSSHVYYQLTQMRPLFSKVAFISNSQVSEHDYRKLVDLRLMDNFIQRENIGFDFAAWRDGMTHIGFEELLTYDVITIMNDTCFGPLWDIKDYYLNYEANDQVDFWGLTNNRKTKKSRQTQGFPEHIQSYFITFKKPVIESPVFRQFWEKVRNHTDVQNVINDYETQVTTTFLDAGFHYQTIFNTVHEDTTGMLHPDFSYYNPTAILKHKVPFIKVKAIDAHQGITPYILDEIADKTNYPIDLIISHMSEVNFPDFMYLLGHKLVKQVAPADLSSKKIAVHLHTFYVDLLEDFLEAFEKSFNFDYDLFITTDIEDKRVKIQEILTQYKRQADIRVTGNIGRDVLPMLKLKEELSKYDYIGHFHTKKSKEADFWAGESWRRELIQMLVYPANNILSNFDNEKLGIVIADIPTFFRYNKIVDAWNEHLIAPEMNDLWKRMGMTKAIDFNTFQSFVMSYGTFVWFKYDALKPLFELGLTDDDVPAEPLPQNSILHAIERLLIYIAWNEHYDFRISKNPAQITAFVDNKLLNERGNSAPNTYVDFTYMGGIRGALKYIFIGPARAVKYIIKRLSQKVSK